MSTYELGYIGQGTEGTAYIFPRKVLNYLYLFKRQKVVVPGTS